MFMSNETMVSLSTGSIRFGCNEAWASIASSFGELIGWWNNTTNGY